ncbi:type I polyketide synthase, partial [Nonomuraea mesophila]
TLHVDEPSPHVDWSAGAVQLLTEPQPWQQNGHARRAAVSSFGVSGTNAHIVLEEHPAAEVAAEPVEEPSVVPWVVSGRSAEALRAQAGRLAEAVAGERPVDVAHSLVASRSVFDHRAVVIGSDRDELVAGLRELAGGAASAVVQGVAGSAGKTVFVFPGQGSQWLGMGVELLDGSPVFAARMAECEAALAP